MYLILFKKCSSELPIEIKLIPKDVLSQELQASILKEMFYDLDTPKMIEFSLTINSLKKLRRMILGHRVGKPLRHSFRK